MKHNTQSVRLKLLTEVLDRLEQAYPDDSASKTVNTILLQHLDAMENTNELLKTQK